MSSVKSFKKLEMFCKQKALLFPHESDGSGFLWELNGYEI